MANADKPRGLTPIRHLNGNPYNGAASLYHIDSAYATDLFIGDPVTYTGTAHTDGVPEVQAAGASGIPIGVIVGFEPTRTNLDLKYSPASTAQYVWVCDDPDVIFTIQDDGAATMTAAQIGLNVDCIAGAGDTTTGRSGYEIDSGGTTTPATTATLMLRLLRVHQREDNEAFAANCEYEVLLNAHQNRSATGV